MKTYYAILRRVPAWVLVHADSLKDARRKVAADYPGVEQLLVKRATPEDIEFVEWCDETKRTRAESRDTGEQGLARASSGNEDTA